MKVEELAYHKTPLGELVLRRRPEPLLGNREVFEVKLGDEYLMSSLFTKSEIQLAHLGLKDLVGVLDVAVGGLGLGYTATAVLDNPNVRSLLVIDLFEQVIEWHRSGLVPLGARLVNDPRCDLKQGDFFALSRTGLDESNHARRFDAILVDIDHSPQHYLSEANASFYSTDGLKGISNQIKEGGVFALWSDDPVNQGTVKHLENVFGRAEGHIVEFPNPYTGGTSLNSVYIARK